MPGVALLFLKKNSSRWVWSSAFHTGSERARNGYRITVSQWENWNLNSICFSIALLSFQCMPSHTHHLCVYKFGVILYLSFAFNFLLKLYQLSSFKSSAIIFSPSKWHLNCALNVGEAPPGEATLVLYAGDHLGSLKTIKQPKPKPLCCLGPTPENLNWLVWDVAWNADGFTV